MASREHRRMIQRKKAGDKTHAERQKQRHPVFYWITFVVLIVVVVAFIGTGVVGGVTQRKRLVFGKYGKNEIELLRGGYSGLNFFTAQIDNFSSQTQNQEQVPNLWRDAFDNAITHYAILELVEKSGYVVSKKRLDRRVAIFKQMDGLMKRSIKTPLIWKKAL